MLENDIYVNHSTLNITEQSAFFDYLRDKIGYTGNDIKTAVLVLCAYSFYVTQEELSFLCPLYPLYSHLSTRVIKPLVEQGYMSVENAASTKEKEGTAKAFYYITAQGYQYANSLCQGKLTTKYKKNRSKVAKSHTYYIGYNFYELLMLGFSMTWQREYLLSERNFSYKSKVPILQVDAKCVLYEKFGKSPFLTIYVEQDLGTEHNDVLLSKIDDYSSLGFMDRPLDSLIMFSFSQKGVTDKRNSSLTTIHPYSKSKCKNLLEFMNTMHLDDVYDAYLAGYPDQQFISQLLVKCGGGRQSKDGTQLTRGREKLSRQFLEDFLTTILEKRNPYQQRDYSLIRAHFAMSRLEEMVKLMYSYADRERPFMNRLRRGYQIYYLPTTLVSERIRYSMPERCPDIIDRLIVSLGKTYTSLRYVKNLSSPFVVSDKAKINLRNEFSSDGPDVYVEYMCFDIGAWLRALFFLRMKGGGKPRHLICVFENNAQMQSFYRAVGKYTDVFSKNSNMILSIMLYDIGKEDKLFYIKNEKMERVYID